MIFIIRILGKRINEIVNNKSISTNFLQTGSVWLNGMHISPCRSKVSALAWSYQRPSYESYKLLGTKV